MDSAAPRSEDGAGTLAVVQEPTRRRTTRPAAVVPDRFQLEPAVRPDPISVDVSKKLLELLLSGTVAVGGRIPSERVLAEQLRVGRSAVRDALRPLALLGIVDVRPGSGSYLAATSSQMLRDMVGWSALVDSGDWQELLEARWVVEPGLASLAARKRTDDDIEALRRCVGAMRRARTRKTMLKADVGFHSRIAAISDNDVLAGVVKSIQVLLRAWRDQFSPGPFVSLLPAIAEQHAEILDGIERGDAEAARRAMERHLDFIRGAAAHDSSAQAGRG